MVKDGPDWDISIGTADALSGTMIGNLGLERKAGKDEAFIGLTMRDVDLTQASDFLPETAIKLNGIANVTLQAKARDFQAMPPIERFIGSASVELRNGVLQGLDLEKLLSTNWNWPHCLIQLAERLNFDKASIELAFLFGTANLAGSKLQNGDMFYEFLGSIDLDAGNLALSVQKRSENEASKRRLFIGGSYERSICHLSRYAQEYL